MHIKRGFIKKMRKTADGVVSILLIIALLPFFSLAAAVIEAERYQNAVKALDEALGSSALSTLAQYDSYLLNRFGLLAVKQTDDEDFIKTQLNRYLHLQKTTDLYGAGTDTLEAEADGVYPLADISILRQQIVSYSSGLVPAKIIADVGQLDTLVSAIEKSFGSGLQAIFSQVQAGAEMLNNEADLIEAIEDAENEMQNVSTAVSSYDSGFSAFETAMNELYDHKNSTRPEDDEEAAAEWDETLASLQESAENARNSYTVEIDKVTDKLNALHDKLEDVISKKGEFITSVNSFSLRTGSALEAIEADNTKDAAEKDQLKNCIKVNSAVDSTLESMEGQFSDALEALSESNFTYAFQSLNNEKVAVSSADTGSGYTGSNEAQYHFVNLEGFQNVDGIHNLINSMEEEAKSNGWLDTLLALFDILNNLFAVDLFFNPELSVTLDTDYYTSEYGGLPGSKDRSSSLYSLDSAYAAADQTRSMGYLAEIDPNYDPNDPYGFYAGSSQAKLDALVNSISELGRKGDNLRSASWLVNKLRAFGDCAAQLWDVIVKFDDFFWDLIANLLQRMYERLLIMGYLGYNLPNRTNYDSGKTLTGYSYSNAALAPSVTGSNIALGLPGFSIGTLISLTTPNINYSFSGAELEYIMWGTNSEIANQTLVFIELWLMRMGLDVLPIALNSEVQSVVESLSATVVGIVAAVVYLVILMIVEPFLDTFFLVNGGSIPFVKSSDKVFLTSQGIDDLVENLTELSLTAENKKDKVKQTLWQKWGESFGEFDYTQHAVILMMLTGSEETYLRRLTNIIQAEGTYRSRTDGATASQQALGTYTNFDIEKAYTTVRIEASGTLKQLLPVPSVLNPRQTNAFDTPFQYNRVLYRGY